jgi:diguanylate cyclase (GGDEF)-like protein
VAPSTSRPARWPAAGVLAAVVVVAGLLVLPGTPWQDDTLAENLIALVAPVLATACAWWRRAGSTGRHRRCWTALAAAVTCWAVGDTVWTWLQAAGISPFPSPADLAYLAFGPLVCVGLLLHPVSHHRSDRTQRVLDGGAASCALLLVSWQTALGAAVRATDDADPVAAVVGLAYPVVDIVVVVLAVLAFAHTPVGRPRLPLAVLALGLLAISAADSAFIGLNATGSYQSGDVLDVIWSLGFGLLGAAALLDDDGDREVPPDRRTTRAAAERVPPAAGLLPYVPIVVASAVVAVMQLLGRPPSTAELLALLGLTLLLLGRQYLALRQNTRLAGEVAAREQELEHLAYHDPLTGLPNRKLFHDRLQHAIELHARDHRPVAVLFLDLDHFKAVNDTHGHVVGDLLLAAVADRIRGTVRSVDTAARLGGDEFAVLLESGYDAHRCAERIIAALREPLQVDGTQLRPRASVGIVELAPGDAPMAADELLGRADHEMYRAKRSRAVGAGSRT